MTDLQLGDFVRNDVQTAVVRWFGTIAGRSVIGLESISAILPGYTDGLCSIDEQRHFECPNGRGFYVLRSSFAKCYQRIKTRTELNGETPLRNENFHSAESTPDTSPETRPKPPIPVISMTNSPSRGILSRLTWESEQQKILSSNSNINQQHRTSPNRSETTDSISKMYRPENYRSQIFDATKTSSDGQRRETTQSIDLSNSSSSNERHSFGHEYFLDDWTFHRIKNLFEIEIPPKHRFCLLVGVDESDVETLVEDQMNKSDSFVLPATPKEIRIELTKIFDDVKSIFPSRTIRLHGNDFLLLSIFCSRNECAYIRTRAGWALIHDEVEKNKEHLVPEISDLIDGSSIGNRNRSEVCSHLLKNASFLFYKLVE